MVAPKPVTLTNIPEGDYDGENAPQPLVVVGAMPGGGGGDTFDLTDIAGYDAGEDQTLKNLSGTFTWVTDEEA